MLRWAVIFLVIALVAALFGFTGIAAAAAGIAKFLFFLFLVICLIFLIIGISARQKNPIKLSKRPATCSKEGLAQGDTEGCGCLPGHGW